MFVLCCRFEQLDTAEKQCGGESVSQSLLKDKAYLSVLGQNLPIELLPKSGVSPPTRRRDTKRLWAPGRVSFRPAATQQPGIPPCSGCTSVIGGFEEGQQVTFGIT